MNAQSPEVQPKVQPEVQPEAQLEVQPDTAQNPGVSGAVKGLRLPEPDRDNITVLLHNLPKDPVLPWNHYDSPWKSEDDRPPEEAPEEAPGEEAAPSEATTESETAPPLEAETGLTETPSEPSVGSSSTADSEDSLTVLPPLDHIPSEALLSQLEADSSPPTIAPEAASHPSANTEPASAAPNLTPGEPGYVHLAATAEELAAEQEAEPLETLEIPEIPKTPDTPDTLGSSAPREVDNPIGPPPDSEPDQQLLAQLG